ncbi:MAG: tail fiber domain-containing protein [Rhizobacter sp.]|nr:tail fiber domain-containing protein [Ferruginibacter sp.]
MKKIFLAAIVCASQLATAQNVGIGTNTPASLLHVNNGTVLFSGPGAIPANISTPPVKGKGIRTFWYADKGAFRTGGVFNSVVFGFPEPDTSHFHNWDKDSIGFFSFAAGFNTKAKGAYSFAAGEASFATGVSASSFGHYNRASGNYSVAGGSNNIAAGASSIALGNGAVASGTQSIAQGNYATASGMSSVAIGTNVEAFGKYANAQGISTIASGERSTSLGDHTTASGDFSTAMGTYSVAGGDYSTAMGKTAKAIGYSSFAAGNNNTASGANSFAMGVNANTNNHSNSFCFSGALNDMATANTADNQMMMRFTNYTFFVSGSNYAYLLPASNGWAYTSDRNKKERFQEMNGETVLGKIAAIPFYSWNFKASDTRQYRHYGIMAQDFYKAFGKDDYGSIGNDSTVSPLDLLGVAYSAIKGLEKRTATLQEQNDRLKNELALLSSMKLEMRRLQDDLEAVKLKMKN